MHTHTCTYMWIHLHTPLWKTAVSYSSCTTGLPVMLPPLRVQRVGMHNPAWKNQNQAESSEVEGEKGYKEWASQGVGRQQGMSEKHTCQSRLWGSSHQGLHSSYAFLWTHPPSTFPLNPLSFGFLSVKPGRILTLLLLSILIGKMEISILTGLSLVSTVTQKPKVHNRCSTAMNFLYFILISGVFSLGSSWMPGSCLALCFLYWAGSSAEGLDFVPHSADPHKRRTKWRGRYSWASEAMGAGVGWCALCSVPSGKQKWFKCMVTFFFLF